MPTPADDANKNVQLQGQKPVNEPTEGVIMEEGQTSKEPITQKDEENKEELETLKTECAELKAEVLSYKEKVVAFENEKRDAKVEVILAEQVDCLTPEQVADFRKEGKKVALSEIDSFEMKVKAAALDVSKVKLASVQKNDVNVVPVINTVEPIVQKSKEKSFELI